MRWFFILTLLLSGCDKRERPVPSLQPQPQPQCTSEPQCGEGWTEVNPAMCEAPDCLPVTECGQTIHCVKETADTGWKAITEAELDESQRLAVQKGRAQQQALGKSLVTTLSKSVAADGFVPSLTMCKLQAPKLTQAAQNEVKVGRTSHKLRNPANAAPAWAAEVVAKAEAGKHIFVGPGGTLGVLSPIMTSQICLNCHGPSDQLADGVTDALAAQYPSDAAIGFEADQLRGWFWAEVAP